jgi:porin
VKTKTIGKLSVLLGVACLPIVVTADEPPALVSLWNRAALGGDWSGIRKELDNYGFTFSPVYTGEVMGNSSGGMKQGTIYDSSLNLPLTIDLSKFPGGWDGGTVYANALWIAGRSLSENYVGSLGDPSNIAGYDTARLQEFWFQQTFWQARASLKIGLVAADTEFFSANASALFMNGSFGTFTLISANLPNPPIYPVAAPAARFLIQPVPQFYFQSGIFYGDSGAQDKNKNGLDFHFNHRDGALILSEIGWLRNQSPGDSGLAGSYKLGSFVHTADFTDWQTGAGAGADYGVYGIVNQELYRHDGKVISFFTRGGGAPANVNTIGWFVDGGFNFSGFIPGRANDIAGIAIARSAFSQDYSDAQVSIGAKPYRAETVLEATYKIQLAPWWTLQPDFQYIFNPGGEEGSHDATIIGLRATVVF